jgi:hypothetical protein
MRETPHDVPFDDVVRICEQHFGTPRQRSGSHVVFKTPWQGDPRVNVQKGKNGRAKSYQVRQVLGAIDRLGVVMGRVDDEGEDADEG